MYYVYIYLDPRKYGKYIYGNYCFLYEPFYIGKGKGCRFKSKNRSEYLKRIINKIEWFGLKPIIIKIKENISEGDSFLLESKLIKLIGRKDLNKGPLINFTDGGEGTSGYIVKDKTKNKLSNMNKGENNPFYGKNHSDKNLKKMSDIKKNKHHSEETKIKMSNIKRHINNPMFGKHHSFEVKIKISKKLKENYIIENHSMFGKKHTEKTLKKMSDIKKNKHHSEETKIKMSESRIGKYLGENSPSAKLTEENVIQIRKYLDEGILTQEDIAKIFRVNRTTISSIKNKRSWSHLKETIE